MKTLIPKKPEAGTQKPETDPSPNIRTPSVVTEASVRPSATTADGLTPPRLTPSSPVKDQTPTSSRPWANLLSPIDRPSLAARPLSRCCIPCSRRALAVAAQPLPRFDMNAAPRRSVGGGGDRNRTDDLLLAKQALSQLSYTPTVLSEAQNPSRRQRRSRAAIAAAGAPETYSAWVPLSRCKRTAVASRHFAAQKSVVGQGGFEPPTSRLSSARSNQLSY